MNENPVIVQFDEDENYNTVLELICFGMGLKISAFGKTIAETRSILDRIQRKEIKPDIAIITSMLEVDLNDGRKLEKKLKELVPSIKTIAYSVDPEVDWGDFKAVKSAKDNTGSIIAVLEQLTGKKYKYNNLEEK